MKTSEERSHISLQSSVRFKRDVGAVPSGVNFPSVILHQDTVNGDYRQARIVHLSDPLYRSRSAGLFVSRVNISIVPARNHSTRGKPMKIFFGKDISYQGVKFSHWENGKGMVFIPATRKKDLFFEICDECGTQVPIKRLNRGLSTCSPQCNAKKWERIKENERKAKGIRPLFWNTFKFECFKRDDYTCQKCGSKRKLECHHKIPVVNGGTNELSNLITLCHDCHKKAHPDNYRRTGRRMRENQTLPIS